MAVPNQEQILEDVQDARSPEGDFFVSPEGQVSGLDLGFLDNGVGQIAQNAVQLYRSLQKCTHEHGDPWEAELEGVTRQAAEEEIATLNEAIQEYVKSQKGYWLLGVTRPPITAASALAKFEQYRVKPPDRFPEDVFSIPSSKVAAGNAFSFHVDKRIYKSFIDLWIQLNRSKEMGATPDFGRWFRFPLETLKLAYFDPCIPE